MNRNKLELPFPMFGGKRQIAQDIWDWFGDPENYLEPFFGGGAVLLNRPHPPTPDNPKAETVNDLNGFIVNFWRAVREEPEAVADVLRQPIHESETHARREWLVEQGGEGFSQQLEDDPYHYNVEMAGWWCWGICCWIGEHWPWAGKRQKPRLSRKGGQGILQLKHRDHPERLLNALSDRLRHVRVICGDWSRTISSKSMLKGSGVPCAIFLDPPYSSEYGDVYGGGFDDEGSLPDDVYEWCEAHGDDEDLRIAVCGYPQNWDAPDDWYQQTWTTQGGWSKSSPDDNPDAQKQECVWFSPHCIHPDQREKNIVDMFTEENHKEFT